MAKMSKAEKLAALREKMSQQDLGGGGAGYFSPKIGRNVIRIMPEVGDMDFFFQPVGRHYFPDNNNVYCPDFTSEGELDCPVCEIVDELRRSKDKASKKLAEGLGRRRSWWMNVIDRNNPGAGPLIFTPGVTVFNSVISLINDPDYGDITDLEEGTDIVIEREGQGLDTSYEVKPRRKESPLSDDEEEIDQWLDDARDLSYVEVSEDPDEDRDIAGDHSVWVYPYDRIVEEFGLESFDQDDFDDEEPVKQPRKSPKKRPVKKDVEDDELDDDEEYIEDEEPPEKEVKRRMTRRSRRR
jgi:hypothetical protein